MSLQRRVAVLLLTFSSACADEGPSEYAALLADNEPGALLSVWGADTDDVWVVGGRALDGIPNLYGSPTVLHFDGASWQRLDSGVVRVDLWSTFGFAGSDVFMAGSAGTILRYRDGAFTTMTTPRASGAVYGMWGVGPDDLWAVGDAGEAGALIWHFDGETWSDVAPPAELPQGVNAFKVGGRASDDVWISCADGAVLRWDGAALAYLPTGDASNLFSIAVSPDAVVAVGGDAGDGELFESDGASWTEAPLASPVAWRGAAVRGDAIVAVGEHGAIARRAAGGAWSTVAQDLTTRNFHAAWIDPDGGLWGVGGLFSKSINSAGVLFYLGPRDDLVELTR